MQTVQSLVATLCSVLVLAPATFAQATTNPTQTKPEIPPPARTEPKTNGSMSWKNNFITRPYRPKKIEAIDLTNSNRAEQLIRAGKIYLSLQDAIALALENNLDIELQRYTPQQAQADLLRAQAGGVIRGVTATPSQGANSAQNFLTGGNAIGGGGVNTSGTSTTGSGGSVGSGTQFQVTGVAIPTLDPSLNFGLTQSRTKQPTTNTIVTGGTVGLIAENLNMTGGISQQFLTGTGYNLSWNQSHISTNQRSSSLNPFFRGNFNLQVTQRLLQGFGVGVNNRNIRIAKNNLKVSDLVFKQQVISTTQSTVNLYLDLVSFIEIVKVRTKAVELAQKLYDDNKKQVEIGTLAPIEVVRAEAQLAQAQTDLIAAETQVLNQETIIKNALSRTGIDSPTWQSARIIPTDTLPTPEIDQLPDMEKLTQEAIMRRPEVDQIRVQISNTKIGLNGARSQLLPSLDAFASMTNNGLAGMQNPLYPVNPPNSPAPDPFLMGGAGRMYDQIFHRAFGDYAVGFQLNVPIRNRAAQADITNDTLNLRRQELQEQQTQNNIKVQVAQAVVNLRQARAGYDSALKARTLQERTLDAEQKKFALGSSTIFVVVQTQRDLTQAQANEVSAITAYNRARNSLDVALGRLLDVHQVDLSEAMSGDVKRPPSKLPIQ